MKNFGIVEKQAADIMSYYYPFEKSDLIYIDIINLQKTYSKILKCSKSQI